MLLVTGSNQVVNPTLLPNPGFDYADDLAPVSMLVASKLLLVASPSFPAKNHHRPDQHGAAKAEVREHRDLGDRHAQSSGSGNAGAIRRVDLTFVPYDGAGQAIPDLIAGRVDLTVAALSTLLPQVRTGALKALAITSPQRSPLCSRHTDRGGSRIAELQLDGWICVLTTGGTPAPIVARLDRSSPKSWRCPQLRDAFAKVGVETFHMNPNQLGAFLHAEAARYSGLLKHSRIRRASP